MPADPRIEAARIEELRVLALNECENAHADDEMYARIHRDDLEDMAKALATRLVEAVDRARPQGIGHRWNREFGLAQQHFNEATKPRKEAYWRGYMHGMCASRAADATEDRALARASQTDTDAVGGRRLFWHTDPGWPCPTCGHVAVAPVPEDTDG